MTADLSPAGREVGRGGRYSAEPRPGFSPVLPAHRRSKRTRLPPRRVADRHPLTEPPRRSRNREPLRDRHGRAAGEGRGVLPRQLRWFADQEVPLRIWLFCAPRAARALQLACCGGSGCQRDAGSVARIACRGSEARSCSSPFTYATGNSCSTTCRAYRTIRRRFSLCLSTAGSDPAS
jgi:hypothetical protein